MTAPQYDGLNLTVRCCKCGEEYPRNGRRSHDRHKHPKEGRPPKPDVRACEYVRCKGKNFTPAAPNQRYCSEACKRLAADPLSYEERERRHMAPRDAAEVVLAEMIAVTGAALIAGRARAYETWFLCLGRSDQRNGGTAGTPGATAGASGPQE